MCESSAYLVSPDKEEQLLLEDVVICRPESGQVALINILGEKKVVQGEIDHIDLLKHRIVVRTTS